MKRAKIFLAILVVLVISFTVFFILTGEKVQVFQPKGTIAKQELRLILFNLALMLAILVPTFFWLLFTAWKYHEKKSSEREAEKKYGKFNQVILWTVPSIVILIMAVETYKKTHDLDPYKRLSSPEEELVIQVVAIDWKWLFIYPEQGIATLNFVQFPEKKPIRFELAADNSPMNSFWIPQLSGQIYCMTGMVTPLHIMADGCGTYPGHAAEINGMGYAQMKFTAVSSTPEDFEKWVSEVKQSDLSLDKKLYDELAKPAIATECCYYSSVEKDLFHTIVMRVNHP